MTRLRAVHKALPSGRTYCGQDVAVLTAPTWDRVTCRECHRIVRRMTELVWNAQ